MVVDDDVDVLEMISESLAPYFNQVVSESKPHEALKKLKEMNIDCVISDYIMPAMNGLELIKAIRLEKPSLPVILLTGNGDNPEVLEAVADGSFDFLEKPYRFEVLLNRVRNALATPRLENLVIQMAKAEFPGLNVDFILKESSTKRIQSLMALEGVILTRLMAKQKRAV